MKYTLKGTCWSFDPTHKDCAEMTYTIQDETGTSISVVYPTKREAEKALKEMNKS